MAGGEAFSRVKIDAQLTDVGWNLSDGRSVHFEYTLDDGARADYVLADRHGRSMAAMGAKRASINPVAVRRGRRNIRSLAQERRVPWTENKE